jgi:hypothetical protein
MLYVLRYILSELLFLFIKRFPIQLFLQQLRILLVEPCAHSFPSHVVKPAR